MLKKLILSKSVSFSIDSIIFKYNTEKGSWFFAKIDEITSNKIKAFILIKKAWGSIPVRVKILNSIWKTSLFPNKEKEYLLPIKKEIRIKEKINEGDLINLNFELL